MRLQRHVEGGEGAEHVDVEGGDVEGVGGGDVEGVGGVSADGGKGAVACDDRHFDEGNGTV